MNASGMARRWLAFCPVAKSVRVQIDVDPYNFL
jgi:primosomal protein N'